MMKLILTAFFILWTYNVNTPKKVALLPLDDSLTQDVEIVKKALESYYNCQVTIWKRDTFPPDHIIFKQDTFKRASHIFDHLKNLHNESFDKYIVITSRVYRPFWTNVTRRGTAELNGRNAVISIYKLKLESEEFKINYDELLIKTARHEYGHLIGLNHCEKNNNCVMIGTEINDNSIHYSNSFLCDSCQNNSSSNLIN